MIPWLTLLFILAFVPLANAQTPAWDVTAMGGMFAGYRPRAVDSSGYQETWFQNALGGVILGRHLTRHLKLELEASATTGGTSFRERTVAIPGYPYPYPIGSDVTTSVRSIAGAVTWQFRENEWIHPFVQAGVTADFDRVTVRTWEQFFYGTRDPGVPPQQLQEARVEGPTVTRDVRAAIGGGAKLYFNARAFVRTDGRWTFDRTRHNIALRLGVGIDF